ncbi:MAG: hypothetical protein R3A13_06755 [Bdellovibrionota bacterium]
MNLQNLIDSKILELTPVKVKTEREATLAVLELLSEIDIRKLYLKEGYNSMYAYLTTGLAYSEGAAQRRISSARALRANEKVANKLKSGDVSLTTLSLVSKDITAKNKPEILETISGKSKREVEKIILKDKPPESKTKESVRTIKVKKESDETSLFNPENNQSSENHLRQRIIDTELRLKFIAEGGQHTVDNLRVLCRSHNQYLAEQKFGRVWERAA